MISGNVAIYQGRINSHMTEGVRIFLGHPAPPEKSAPVIYQLLRELHILLIANVDLKRLNVSSL